ncbi:uncharacterized protein [Diabrotica undecimpunctata]|uniref:uncharacterized protein n=1 Tax=Diabrotica undecimpunctata TaxID=50387 RepID=UPI003B632BC7
MESSDSSSVYLGSDISSSSDSEDNIFVPKTRNENYVENTVPSYSNQEFFEHFRVSKQVASNLSEKFKNSTHFSHQMGEFGKITALQYVLVYLWFAGYEAASYRDVSDRFNISLSSLRKIIVRMTYFLSNLAPEIIQWPNFQERINIERCFRQNGFPGAIGAIDGSHIKIDKPSEDPDTLTGNIFTPFM